MSKGTYTGRMVCDGEGHLYADEGKDAGKKIAWVADDADGHFEFIGEGDPSHNDRHHAEHVNLEVVA